MIYKCALMLALILAGGCGFGGGQAFAGKICQKPGCRVSDDGTACVPVEGRKGTGLRCGQIKPIELPTLSTTLTTPAAPTAPTTPG